MERGDAEVDTVKAIVDIEERRRRNRGRQGTNGRVDAEVDAVSRLSQGVAGFAKPNNASRTNAHTGVANIGPAQKVSMMVAACGAVG